MPDGAGGLIETVIARVQAAESAYELGLFDGCPCFELRLGDVVVYGHCWRTCNVCEGCGVHWAADLNGEAAERLVAALVAKLNEMDWYGEWSVVAEDWPGGYSPFEREASAGSGADGAAEDAEQARVWTGASLPHGVEPIEDVRAMRDEDSAIADENFARRARHEDS